MRQILLSTLVIVANLLQLTPAFTGLRRLHSLPRPACATALVRRDQWIDNRSPIWMRRTKLKSSDVDLSVYAYETSDEELWESSSIGQEFDLDGENASNTDDDDLDETEEEGSEEDDVDDDDYLIQEYQAYSEALEKAVGALERKQLSLQSELKKAEDIEKTVTRANLIVSNLFLFTKPSIKTVTIQDWDNDGNEIELTLDTQYDSALAEADALFAQARKLKRGSHVITGLLEQTDALVQLLRDAEIDFKACWNGERVDEGMFEVVKKKLESTADATKFRRPSNEAAQNRERKKSNVRKQNRSSDAESSVRRLKSPGGCVVLVGRNRRGNEYLSFQVARANDIWMHARGCPGAHVILQQRRGSPEHTQACLEFCANIAVFYSDARNERKASVTAADSKHLLKPRGAPLGAVKLREELYVLIGYPEQVPEELKLARDECGQTDEFRAQDKAKRRKRTQEVAKQVRAKRREQKSSKRKAKGPETSTAPSLDISFDPY